MFMALTAPSPSVTRPRRRRALVERAVVILFGLSATLAPTLNTLRVGFPYVMKFAAAAKAQPAAASMTAARAPEPSPAEPELDAHLN